MRSALLVLALAASSVNAFTGIDLKIARLFELYGTQSCDTAEFNFTDGCTRTQGYWGTHYGGAEPEVKDIPWPGTTYEQYITQNPNCPIYPWPLGVPRPLMCYDPFYPYSNQSWLTQDQYFLGTQDITLVTNPDPCRVYPFFEGSYTTCPPSVTCEDPVYPIEVIEKGNAQNEQNGPCFIVGRQYIATLLNLCSGACWGYGLVPTPVTSAMETAAEFLFGDGCQNTPREFTNVSAAVLDAKDVLDDYNNGAQTVVDGECVQKYGPVHCDGYKDVNTTTCDLSDPDECPIDTCEGGCTLTQGFWKTHRLSTKTVRNKKNGNSVTGTWGEYCPYDFLSSVPGMTCADGVCSSNLETTQYYLIPALTWGEVLDTPPQKGEACLIAAKQLIAAELNSNCGSACTTSNVDIAIAAVKEIMALECLDLYFDKQGPHDGLDSSVSSSNSTSGINRRRILEYASYLDAYNNGINIGPGHCDDSNAALIAAAIGDDGFVTQTADVDGVKATRVYGWMDWIIFVVICAFAVLKFFAFLIGLSNDKPLHEMDPVDRAVVYASAKARPAARGTRRGHPYGSDY